MRPTNPVFADLPTTIFTRMSALAAECGAINLGQGFPDGDGPAHLRELAARALVDGPNQYPPSTGVPILRRAVADHGQRFYDLRFDADAEIIVTSGATEALADCLLALLAPGDEAIVIEPAFDSYAPVIRAAGAVPRFVPLQPPHWHLDADALEAACNSRTRLLILNTPMNPTGKVFTEPELSLIADVMFRHELVAVCDEVYEHITFDGRRHVPLMCLPGMRERCVRIGSAGKTFSMTGWKVGYICAPRTLAEVIARVHQFVTFTTVPALQHAVAAGLASADGYFTGLARQLQQCRDLLHAGLADTGFDVLPCQGTYFLTVDFRAVAPGMDDVAFCEDLVRSARVAAIPVSAFYDTGTVAVPRTLARFAFCKDPAVLTEAVARLQHRFT